MNRRTLLGSVAALTAGAGCLSQFSGRQSHLDVPCPTVSESVDILCTHTGADPDLELRPASWHLSAGEDVSLTVTLSNDADGTARVSDYPMLWRYADDGWEHVWPPVVPTQEKRLDPGETYAWKFLFSAEGSSGDADEAVYLYGLDAGETYALAVDAELPERAVQCVAAFEVGG